MEEVSVTKLNIWDIRDLLEALLKILYLKNMAKIIFGRLAIYLIIL